MTSHGVSNPLPQITLFSPNATAEMENSNGNMTLWPQSKEYIVAHVSFTLFWINSVFLRDNFV